jgi:(hydroxyamino)benzene mutase
MAGSDFDRAFTRAGFSLILLALITGFGIPNFLNPRMAVAAHLSGVLNGLLLIALSSVWSRVALSPGQLGLAKGVSLFAAYGNWATSCLAAAWGTSRMTPLAGAGHAAVPWKESVVQVTQVSLVMAILLALGLVLYGLRRSPIKT